MCTERRSKPTAIENGQSWSLTVGTPGSTDLGSGPDTGSKRRDRLSFQSSAHDIEGLKERVSTAHCSKVAISSFDCHTAWPDSKPFRCNEGHHE